MSSATFAQPFPFFDQPSGDSPGPIETPAVLLHRAPITAVTATPVGVGSCLSSALPGLESTLVFHLTPVHNPPNEPHIHL
jgi:hypothetical protein